MKRFLASLLPAVFLCSTVGLSAAERPNVVWLVSEDNSVHYLKHFDPHGAPTPRIEALAAHGLTFDQAFSNAPVCSVARTTLATGCYGPRIGTQYHRKSVAVPLPEGMKMFPEHLRDAGYYTANNSKTDYNAIPGKNVWDESSRKATWRKRKDDQPFFYMQSFAICHESSLHFSAKVMATEKTTTDPKSVFVAPYHPDTPTFRYTNARYRDRIMQMDRQIGSVVDALTTDGLLEDTFIFYFGDHGGVLPRGKGYACESGLHVPLVVRVPDRWKHLAAAELGSRQNGFVSFIDFGPTTLNLAGVAVPEQMDGRPFLGKDVSQKEVESRDEALGYADRFDEKYDLVRTLRKGKYDYVRNYQPFNFDGLQNNYRYRMLAYTEWRKLYQEGKLNAQQRQFFESRPAEQLFDVEADPHEVNNLATDPAYAKVLQDMRDRLTTRVKELPDLSFFPESHLADAAFDNPVKFGQRNAAAIGRMVDIANLQLLPWQDAEGELKQVLGGLNRWEIYWALVTCSSFADEATSLAPMAEKFADQNLHGLVKVRAAEFLGLIGKRDPQTDILSALSNTSSGIEAGLMLNSLVLLKDSEPGYEFAVSKELFQPGVANNDTVKRRLEYLTGELFRKPKK
ncbi:MAG: sulfatase [Fuerstiella sp.]|nr:sulfatase [Fuerstiella sp.]MCP4853300.1 sulfatase [Fuerstiella sp.]